MSQPAELRPAATTILTRQSPGSPELLFVVRPASMRFLGGFHAFVGGALEPSDYSDEAIALSVLQPAEADRRLRGDNGAFPSLGFFICAIREIFEEVGILYAVDAAGAEDSPLVRLGADEVDRIRRRLLDDRQDFPSIVGGLGLKMATDRFHYRTRWVAPPMMAVRFDARFFVAEASGEVIPEEREIDRVDWLSAEQAVALAESGSIRMAPPTMATVSALLRYESLDALLEGAAGGEIPTIERLSRTIRRVLAPNPSMMSGPGTNTYLVGTDEIAVIDPGSMEPAHLDAVSRPGNIKKIIVTHHHPDHFAGALELSTTTGAPVFVHEKFQRSDLVNLERLQDGDSVEFGNHRLEVLYTPGHASDHICLWLPEEGALFSGDLILGEGTPVISPPDGNLVDYLSSLNKVRSLPIQRLYPAHFNPRDDAQEWIAWYVEHRVEREKEITSALQQGAATPKEIVAKVYSAYPPALYPVAERSVLAHLEKLVLEGRVAEEGGSYRLLH